MEYVMRKGFHIGRKAHIEGNVQVGDKKGARSWHMMAEQFTAPTKSKQL